MMNPGARLAGGAGMIAGVLLIFETSCFLLSGWTAARFADPAQAIALLRTGGALLRAAAVFGFAGLIVTTLLIAGLAAALQAKAPGRAAAVLYFGIIGIVGHSLVPLGLWIGVPEFLSLAAHNPQYAQNGWAAFAPVSDTAHGVSSLFGGASMLIAGWAMVSRGVLSRWAGWAGMGAGALTLGTLLSVGTPAAQVGGMLFMPSLALTVVFRFWAGASLWKLSNAETEAAPRRAPAAV